MSILYKNKCIGIKVIADLIDQYNNSSRFDCLIGTSMEVGPDGKIKLSFVDLSKKINNGLPFGLYFFENYIRNEFAGEISDKMEIEYVEKDKDAILWLKDICQGSYYD